MTWNQGSSSDDKRNSDLSSSSELSKLLKSDNEGLEYIQFEYEKFVLKGEEGLKNGKKLKSILIDDPGTLRSSSSLPTSTCTIQNEKNGNLYSARSVNSKNDNSIRTNNNNNIDNNDKKLEIIEDYERNKIDNFDNFEKNSHSNIWNLKVRGLSDDGKSLVIKDVDWTWQQGDLNVMSDDENEDMEEWNRDEERTGGGREEGRRGGGIELRLSNNKNKDVEKEKGIKSIRKEQTKNLNNQRERTSSKSPYLQGVTHLCIQFMSYSTILSEIASNAHTLPNIISLRLSNNDLSTINQVTIRHKLISSYFLLFYNTITFTYLLPFCFIF
jgi:hypothetical protein